MRKINSIIIHCSDSTFGDAATIDKWHKLRGWKGIGYHYVILNGRISSLSPYNAVLDGGIEAGRPVEERGAHVKGHNKDSIGICMIGKDEFSDLQLVMLQTLVKLLMAEHSVPAAAVLGHYELDSGKTCPNFDMAAFREALCPS